MFDGALLVAGTLAVLDNVLVHWALGWHRLVDGWEATLYAEAALVALGLIMVGAGARRTRRRLAPTSRPHR